MTRKKKVTATVLSQKQIGEQIFDLWLETKLAKNAHPGQFVAVYPHGESMLLPRPISICETDQDKNRLRLVYRVAGKGTAEFSTCKAGDKLNILGVLGYRNKDLFLEENLEKYGDVYVATEDGSVGTKGTVMDIIKAYSLQADMIMACGPMPMLRAIKEYAAKQGMEAYISLEERMACGVGACLGCVCKTTEEDAHSHVHNARICTEGPVFEAGEVDI